MIENGTPIILLEAKALYSFDAVMPAALARYAGYIHGDIAKASDLAAPDTQIVVAMFMTHIATHVPDHLDRIVKYRPNINKSLKEHPDPRDLRTDAVVHIEGVLRPLGLTKRAMPSPIGTAFDIPVQVDAWVTHVTAP